MTFEQFIELLQILLPVLGVLSGVALSEYLSSKRLNKQLLGKEVMQKKLATYEALFVKMQELQNQASSFFEHVKNVKTKEELKKIPDGSYFAGLEIAKFTDAHKLYLDEEVSVHIVATALGPSGVLELDPRAENYQNDVDGCVKHFNADYSTAVDMLEEYSGINRLRSSLRKINNPKTTSHIVEYMKKARKDLNKSKP